MPLLDTAAYTETQISKEAEAGKLPVQSQPGLHRKTLSQNKKEEKYTLATYAAISLWW